MDYQSQRKSLGVEQFGLQDQIEGNSIVRIRPSLKFRKGNTL